MSSSQTTNNEIQKPRELADPPAKTLAESERQKILITCNQTEAAYSKDRCVHQLVEEQVRRAPEAVAVVSEGQQLTYRELNERANQLAHHLQKLGVGPDALVGICMERSAEMVVGLLGILKAGGAYLPLDPGYPTERLAFMLKDAGVRALLTQQRLGIGTQSVNSDCKIVLLDAEREALSRYPMENPQSEGGSENLAYVIYTSGSTGQPKGVELTHRGLLNLIFWHQQTYRVSPADKATQLAGVGFDAAVWELWPYLTAGASIHMPDEDTRLLPEKLRDWLVKNEITLSFVPTPIAETMMTLYWPDKVSLRAMLTGGDRLTRYPSRPLPFQLVNHYGPTESTVVTTCAVVENEGRGSKAPSIGKPIANTEVYVLDKNLQLVPAEVEGELYIGGDGLARGYLRRPELTAEKFIANPFSNKPGARLYKTGDLVRYTPTGMIEFVGRNDDQVKIRGFRIELGEIQTVLAGHPGVKAAVVLAREDDSREKRLVAYVVLQEPAPGEGELREYLKQRLPDYMVPAVFIALGRLPLTSHGKIDRAALPVPDEANTMRNEASADSLDDIEKSVAGILASLLKLDKVDAQANFFDLGGHSLLGTQIIARISDEFGVDLPLRKIFESPTVAELSAEIEQMLVAELEADEKK